MGGILFLLGFAAVFGAWSVWVILRTQQRKDAGQNGE